MKTIKISLLLSAILGVIILSAGCVSQNCGGFTSQYPLGSIIVQNVSHSNVEAFRNGVLWPRPDMSVLDTKLTGMADVETAVLKNGSTATLERITLTLVASPPPGVTNAMPPEWGVSKSMTLEVGKATRPIVVVVSDFGISQTTY